MSDVFDEVISRLKQKAKSIDDLHEIYHTDYLDSCLDDEPPWFWFWVRLEDVKEAINQLKQKYVLVSKEKLIEIYKNLEIDKISGYYVNLEFFRMIEELLRGNEG